MDNGRPFGDPQRQTIPYLALWLIGLGIGVIWNRPKIPQDNAKVERGQGVLTNWVEPRKCPNIDVLQHRLLKEAHFQRAIFSVSRLGGKTRIEAFPQLNEIRRAYNPQNFDLQRVLRFLEEGQWNRTVSKVGQISHFGDRFQVGMKYKYRVITIKMEASSNRWVVYDPNGKQIKAFDSNITAKRIWNLNSS